KGVSWHTKGHVFMAQIKINQKSIHLGSFTNEEDAARAYDKKAKELFGDFAFVNLR
ncbi:MAG TPA: AP2 domain-containing protein, partial [Elusimicrobiota bacterium]|nr:AP2 domain-containing protein [Elusimicrobiota bacterium]